MKLLIMKFSPLTCYLVPLKPKYSPQLYLHFFSTTILCLSIDSTSGVTRISPQNPLLHEECLLKCFSP
jgi:hypothetical protein